MKTTNSDLFDAAMTQDEYQAFEDYSMLYDANLWLETRDKFQFCLTFLEINPWTDNVDKMVAQITLHFEYLLDNATIDAIEYEVI